jgi:hypothetical protein
VGSATNVTASSINTFVDVVNESFPEGPAEPTQRFTNPDVIVEPF